MSEQLFGTETLFAHMSMAVKTLDEVTAIAVYEQMEPKVVERLYREVLTTDEQLWVEAIVKVWEQYKERHA